MRYGKVIYFFMATLFFSAPQLLAQPVEHFYNDPANVVEDPDLSDAYPAPVSYVANQLHHLKKSEMITSMDLQNPRHLFGIGVSNVSFQILKNETATVQGFFRDHTVAAEINDSGIQSIKMLVNLDSLDTGVLGRNSRITDLFFKTMDPELITAEVRFNTFEVDQAWEEIADGLELNVKASGVLDLNKVTSPIQGDFKVVRNTGVWHVRSEKSIEIFISDFAYDEEIYALMKACNHASIGNKVSIDVELFLK